MKLRVNYPSFDSSILIVDYCPWLWCVRRTTSKRTCHRCLRSHFGTVLVIQLKCLDCHRLRRHRLRHSCPHTLSRCSHPISYPIARCYSRNRCSLQHPVRCYFESIKKFIKVFLFFMYMSFVNKHFLRLFVWLSFALTFFTHFPVQRIQ